MPPRILWAWADRIATIKRTSRTGSKTFFLIVRRQYSLRRQMYRI
jgi:hypothetical protein